MIAQEFFNLAEAALHLKISERAVIELAADRLPVCFIFRGNLAGYAKGKNPQLFRCWFDGYLRSRAPVRLHTEVHHTHQKIVGGRKMIDEYQTVADVLAPGAVDFVKNLNTLPDPPVVGDRQYLTRLDDAGMPTSASIAKADWLFHRDDLALLFADADHETPMNNGQDLLPAAESIRKRCVLIKECAGFWTTIESDLNDSGRNELHTAAKHKKHGFWKVEPALKWAMERGKIDSKKASTFVGSNDENELSSMLKQLLNQL